MNDSTQTRLAWHPTSSTKTRASWIAMIFVASFWWSGCERSPTHEPVQPNIGVLEPSEEEGTSVNEPEATGSVSGRVTLDGNPVSQASVWIEAEGGVLGAASGPNGGFLIENVPAGSHVLHAKHEDIAKDGAIEIAHGERVEHDVELTDE